MVYLSNSKKVFENLYFTAEDIQTPTAYSSFNSNNHRIVGVDELKELQEFSIIYENYRSELKSVVFDGE